MVIHGLTTDSSKKARNQTRNLVQTGERKMVLSSVDVCDLMINLLCSKCTNRECAEDDGAGGHWSHSKLMDCIRQHTPLYTGETMENNWVKKLKTSDKVDQALADEIDQYLQTLPVDKLVLIYAMSLRKILSRHKNLE